MRLRRPSLLRAAALPVAAALVGACTIVQRFDAPAADPSDGGSAEAPLFPEWDGGACLYDCLGGACRGGLCQPVELARDQGNANGLSFTGFVDGREVSLDGPDQLALDATHVWFSKLDGEIRRVPRGGGAVETVMELSTRPPYRFVLAGDDVVVALGWGIERASKAGGPVSTLYGALGGGSRSSAATVAVTDDALVWPEGTEVHACPRAGCTEPPRCLWASAAADEVEHTIVDLLVSPRTGSDELTTVTLSGRLQSAFVRPSAVCAPPPAGNFVQGGPSLYGLRALGDRQVVAWGERVVLRGSSFLDFTYLASGETIRPLRAEVDATHVYWIDAAVAGAATRLLRVPLEGVAPPEIVLTLERGVRNVVLEGPAAFVSTGDGRILRFAKPPAGVLPQVR